MYERLLLLCLVLGIPFACHANRECGRVNAMEDRIVNGRDVGYLKYPWYAALTLRLMEDRLMCGGTLVGPRHVLTAAHCFKPFFSSVDSGKLTYEELYHIKLGINNICTSESSQKVFSTSKVFIHEKYRQNMPYYDITLIELEKEAEGFTPNCLPAAELTQNNRSSEGYIIGLGKESSHAFKLPCFLQEAKILIYNDSVCTKMLNSMNEDGSKLTNAFCAGYLSGGTDSCQGDSGGPFQTVDTKGTYTLNGITSYGFGCAEKDVLGVYTDVSHYLDWIAEKMALSTSSNSNSAPPTTTTAITTTPVHDYTVPVLNHWENLTGGSVTNAEPVSTAGAAIPISDATTTTTTTTTTTASTSTTSTAAPKVLVQRKKRRRFWFLGPEIAALAESLANI